MGLKVTKRQIQRQAIDAINNPPKATDKVRVSKDNQVEKQKMVHDLIPFLMMLYKKHMDAEITESQLNEGPKAGIYKGFVKISNQKVPVEVELYGVDNKKRMYLTRILHAPKQHGSILRVGNILPIPARLFTGPGGGWVRVNTKGQFENTNEDLRNWFGKGKTGSNDGGGWDRYGTDGQKLGKCGDGDDGDAYAACLSKEKAAKLGPEGRAAFVRRKRADQKKAGDAKKGGEQKKGQKPTFSKTGASESIKETIKKIDGKYVVYSKSGGDRLGTHDTYEDALNQLQAIEASKARNEDWSQKYKRSIDCNNPKGFSQKAHCQGRKKNESTINEIPMDDLKDVDRVADKFLNPVDVVITDKHFFDRLNDPRNGKEISQAELIGFFKRLSKHKKQFMEFLEKYEQMVAFDNRTNINIPFMKQANKAIAKTIMRKKDFKSSTPKLEI